MDKRNFPFELKQLDVEEGIFEGYAAVFGNVDEGGDVIVPGAFSKTLQERGNRIKITWQHDWREPIGKPLELREDEHGLYIKGKLTLDTQRGREALALMRDGVIDELSIGYDAIKSEYVKRDGRTVRELREIRLYEISPVTVAMNEEARIMNVKAAIPYKRTPLAPEDTPWDAAREVAEADIDDLKVMCAIVQGDGERKQDYKLPHHKAAAPHACVWRGVAACAAVLMGARGGVQASPEEIAGAKRHIARHYEDFDKGEPPWEKGFRIANCKDYDPEDWPILLPIAFKNELAVGGLESCIQALAELKSAAEPPKRALTAQELRAKALELEIKLRQMGGK